jgi:hypothetical protein
VLFARAAFGTNSIAVLFQLPGVPYRNWFTITDLDGKTLLAPMALDPAGWDGEYSGDVVFDGTAFITVWRSDGPPAMVGGPLSSQIGWLRVDEATRTLAGPVVVAQSGQGTAADPVGRFEPFSPLSVRVLGDRSVVAFTREEWDLVLAQAIPRAELAMVSSTGAVIAPPFEPSPSGFFFYRESRVYRVGD